jgi:hypothetical protein
VSLEGGISDVFVPAGGNGALLREEGFVIGIEGLRFDFDDFEAAAALHQDIDPDEEAFEFYGGFIDDDAVLFQQFVRFGEGFCGIE